MFVFLNVPFQLVHRLPGPDFPGPLKMVDHMNHTGPTQTTAYTGIGFTNTLPVQCVFKKSGSAILKRCEMRKYSVYTDRILARPLYLYVSVKIVRELGKLSG